MTKKAVGFDPQRITVETEDVDPELAAEWLELNLNNRLIRKAVVAQYSRDMKSGAWLPTGESIKFSTRNVLLDGQHRLWAVVDSGVTVPMFVVRGLPDEAQTAMDSGPSRTAGDALRFHGHVLPHALASVVRLAMTYEAGMSLTARTIRPTHREIIEYLEKHPDLQLATQKAKTYSKGIDARPNVLGLAIYRLRQLDETGCDIFLTKLAEKSTSGRGDPLLALLDRLAEIRRSGRIATEDDYLSLIFRAWNYWRKGESVANLPLRKGGAEVDIPVPR